MSRIESAIVAESKASHSQEFGIAGIRHSQELSVTTSTARNDERSERPLHGILVLDFSQFLSRSLPTLRLPAMAPRVSNSDPPAARHLAPSLSLRAQPIQLH